MLIWYEIHFMLVTVVLCINIMPFFCNVFSEDTSAYRTLWCNANYNLHRYFQIPLICCTTTDLLSCFSSKAIKNLYAQVGMDHQSTVEVFSDVWSTRMEYPETAQKIGVKVKFRNGSLKEIFASFFWGAYLMVGCFSKNFPVLL